MNRNIIYIAAHEIQLSFKDRYFRLILILFLALTTLSTILGALQVHQQMAVYNESVSLLKSMGKIELPSPPSFNPLGVSKDFVNYTSMIGALLAILVGWNSMQYEKDGKVLSLLLSRPVYRDKIIAGKFMGTSAILLMVTAAGYLIVSLLLLIITGVPLSSGEAGRMAVYFLQVWFYLLVFSSLSQFLTFVTAKRRTALLTAIIVWLILTFLLPQIGDTMDLDNQIPEGFFAYLGLDRTQETTLLSHFAWYEYVRDGLEELSPTKHFERISFALLNIKPGFTDYTTLQVLASKALNSLVLALTPVIFMVFTMVLFLRREINK